MFSWCDFPFKQSCWKFQNFHNNQILCKQTFSDSQKWGLTWFAFYDIPTSLRIFMSTSFFLSPPLVMLRNTEKKCSVLWCNIMRFMILDMHTRILVILCVCVWVREWDCILAFKNSHRSKYDFEYGNEVRLPNFHI